MPNPFGSSPYHGSVNWGANRIRRLFDREERAKRAHRSFISIAPSASEETSPELEVEQPLGSTG